MCPSLHSDGRHLRRPRSRLRDQRGQSLVELALAFPILLLILLAILQFGLLLNSYVEVTQAARVGARQASLAKSSSEGSSKAVAAAKAATSAVDDEDLAVTMTTESGWGKGKPVKVQVAYPVSVDVLGFVVKSGMLRAEATARVQQ